MNALQEMKLIAEGSERNRLEVQSKLNSARTREDALTNDLSIWKQKACEAAEREAALREELDSANECAMIYSDQAQALQQRLTVAEQRNASIVGKVSSCKDCGSADLFWFAQNIVRNGIQQNRLNTHDVECVFFLGCNHCSATLKQVSADMIAEKITAALKPAAEGEGS